ncbi:MAG: polyketide cyclase / dehydrase and lipid transport family protein [Acidimicrobiales bacterium]
MQRREFSFEIDAPRRDIWSILHPRLKPDPDGARRVLEGGGVRIEIMNLGDEHGEGLVRTCTYRMPRWVLSGGVGRSWECVTEVRPDKFSSTYEAIARHPWAFASGRHRLDDLGAGRTKVCFGETYELASPVMRPLVESRLHAFITRDNEQVMRDAITAGLQAIAAHRAARSAQQDPG